MKKLGGFGFLANKSFIIVVLEIERSRILFTNLHLPAGNQNREKRLLSLQYLLNQLEVVPGLSNYHFGFLLGDFNFRTNIDPEELEEILEEEVFDFQRLKKFDEFSQFMKGGKRNDVYFADQENALKSFGKLVEGEIKFPPSYKYERNMNVYRLSDKHIPSYTDRIFSLVNSKKVWMEQVNYSSCFHLHGSDHKPIYAQYEVRITN